MRAILRGVGLSLAFAVLIAFAQPSTASAQVPDDTPLRLRWTWPGDVTFCADTRQLPEGVTAATFRDWVQQAMDSWNATGADLRLVLAPSDCAFAEDNGRNEVAFEVYDVDSAEVGRAYSTTLSGVPVEGDVTLRLNWTTAPHCRVSSLVHEFGHVLGFTHSEFRTDVMGYGPCAVLQPSPVEVAMLLAGYGPRSEALTLASAPPDSSATLTLIGTQTEYAGDAGAYYFAPSVVVTGGGALALRPPECLTESAPADDECTQETSLPNGFWPLYSRQTPLAEVGPLPGQSVLEAAGSLGHFARALAVCNALGCGPAFDVRAGDVRVNGTGVDFGYLLYPTPDGNVSVQVVNLSFYAPPHFLDVPATFEVRERGVPGAAGRLGECTLTLGQACEVAGPFAGTAVEVVLVSGSGASASRTGVWVDAVGLYPGATAPGEPSGTTPISGSLPSRGFALALWGGGPVSQAGADPRIGAIFVSVDGSLRGFVVGAPAFVNAGFLATVGEEIPAGTPVVVVVR